MDNLTYLLISISFYSANWTQGAVVSLYLDENEREFDRCPMYFNDGTNPWINEENHIRIFNFDDDAYNHAINVSLPWSLQKTILAFVLLFLTTSMA